MTSSQVRSVYPHHILSNMVATAMGDERKSDRRANTTALDASTEMHEQRRKFEADWLKGMHYMPGTRLDIVRGEMQDDGTWKYFYSHVNFAWMGWVACLKAHGVVLS